MSLPDVLELQGDEIMRAPKTKAGIYAWYFRPRVFHGTGPDAVAGAISQFINTRTVLDAEIRVRYGLRFHGQTHLDVYYGSDRKPAAEVIASSVADVAGFIQTFIQRLMIPCFAKPLYIGISTDLFRRVYTDHYLALTQYWDTNSQISRYLSAHPEATVQEVLDGLGLTHTFAIEACVRRLAPRDLVVFICPTSDLPASIVDPPDASDDDERPALRTLEQVLQMLADPICGRR